MAELESSKYKTINVSIKLKAMAELQPYKRAVVYPVTKDDAGRIAYSHLTFEQLDTESDRIANGLAEIGITRGMRTILMVKPSPDFFALTFALFKIGAVPVIVDPGMGIDRMVCCLQESKAEAFIGISLAHVMRIIYPKHFKTVKICVTVGRRLFWGGFSLADLRKTSYQPYPIAQTAGDETAAILFTTGSTGPAKGVVYTHQIFDSQVQHIRNLFNITEDEIDLPTFPLFALFDPVLGMTAIIPDMDPTRPAKANPEVIIQTIRDHGVTNMFASPALLKRIGTYGKENGIKVPTLKRVISAGAPVYPVAIELFSSILTENARVYTPYGATEAMPVTCIDSKEILQHTRKYTEQGYGMCIGYPVKGIDVRIIQIIDDPIQEWYDELEVPDGEIGEISVRGDIVTKQYFERPADDALAKISDGHDIWHRMGDLGWKDKKGRIWFCGRKSHRVQTEHGNLYTIPCEAIFNNHPAVFRSALVGVGDPPNQIPVICIELAYDEQSIDKEALKIELLNLAASYPLTKPIRTILFHKGFPVDIRHNSKIFREKLADWAQNKLQKG